MKVPISFGMQCNWDECNAQDREHRRWYRRPRVNMIQSRSTSSSRIKNVSSGGSISLFNSLTTWSISFSVTLIRRLISPDFTFHQYVVNWGRVTFWKVCTLSNSASSVETNAASSSAVHFRPSLVPFLIYKISHQTLDRKQDCLCTSFLTAS